MTYLSEEQRNKRFEVLKQKQANQYCADCNSKFPLWATVTFGILICMDCSARHRSYGPQISFVRSITMDNWSEEEILKMELGGNKNFKNFLNKKGLEKANYRTEELVQYKRELQNMVQKRLDETNDKKQDQNIQQEENIQQEQIVIQEQKIEEPKQEIKFDIVEETKEIKKPMQKGKKKKLGKNRINKQIDFNSLVTDDLKIKEVNKVIKEEQKPIKKIIKTGLVNEQKQTSNSQPIQQEQINLDSLGNKTGYGSDDLYPEQQKQVNLNTYQIGSGFGSDQIDSKQETQIKLETPFMNFVKRATNKVTNTTKSVITQIKESRQ